MTAIGVRTSARMPGTLSIDCFCIILTLLLFSLSTAFRLPGYPLDTTSVGIVGIRGCGNKKLLEVKAIQIWNQGVRFRYRHATRIWRNSREGHFC